MTISRIVVEMLGALNRLQKHRTPIRCVFFKCLYWVSFYEILLYILIDWEKQTALSQKQNKVTENAEHNFNYWTNFAGEKTQKLGQKSKKISEINKLLHQTSVQKQFDKIQS